MNELARCVKRSVYTLVVVALAVMTLGVAACKKGPNPEEAKTEALTNLRRLTDNAVAYFQATHTNARGDILPRAFPGSVGLTPAEVPCGEPHRPEGDDWNEPTWQDLIFAISDPHYYSFQFDSAGTGLASTFTVSAFGNLDCDDIYSTFVRVGQLEGTELQVSDIFGNNEDE